MSRLGETIPRVLGTTIVVLGVLILLAAFGFSLYLLSVVIGPWIISALMAAAIPYGLSLFIVILPALIFAAPLFVFLCLSLSNLPPQAKNHWGKYFERRNWALDDHTDTHDILFGINFTFSLLAGTGAGIYLSVLIVPTFISTLTATGTPYLLALSAGIVTGGAFITLTILFLMAPLWIYWRIMALPGVKDLKENPLQVLPLLAMFGGLAFGGYLVSLVAPLLIAALAPIGIPHAAAIFAVIVICSELVLTTSFVSFAATSGIPYLFNHVNFKPFVDHCAAFITSLSKLTEAPKPLPKFADPNPIKQAIAEYHQNKPLWRKFLSFFSHSLGTNRDIEKIERFIEDHPNWQENQEALTGLLRERAAHTYGSYHFYTQSPNNAVNKAYMSIAKIIAGQPSTSTPNYAAWSNLLELKDDARDAKDAEATDLVITGTKTKDLFLIKSIRKMIGLSSKSSPETKRLVDIMSDILPQGIRVAYEARNNLPPELCGMILEQCGYELVPLSELKDKDNDEPKEDKLYIAIGTGIHDAPISYVMMDAKERKEGTIDGHHCRQIVKSVELPDNLEGWEPHTQALIDHILEIPPAENQETEAPLAASFKKNALACFFSPFLATFYDEESDIAFKEVNEYATTHGLLEGDILHDLSLPKLLNPLRWIEFFIILLILSINSLIYLMGIWPYNKLSELFDEMELNQHPEIGEEVPQNLGDRLGIQNHLLWTIVTGLGILIVGFLRYCISLPIKIIGKTLIAILTSLTTAAVFLLRSLSAPIDTVLVPWLKLYREQPIKFFALFLVSTALVAFLIPGFGLGTMLPGLMWLSNSLFGLASLASAGSPILMVIMSTLLMGLLVYETMAALDALIIPFTTMALTTLKNGLYYLSEIRFKGLTPRYDPLHHEDPVDPLAEEPEPVSANDILPKFESRYPVSLEMPSLSIQSYIRLDTENLGGEAPAAEALH